MFPAGAVVIQVIVLHVLDVAREVADRLIRDGYVPRGWLDVELTNVTNERATLLGLEAPRGAVVVKVVSEPERSPASKAGLQAEDVVIVWDGVDVADSASLSQLVARTKVGSTVKISIMRDGQLSTLDVTIAERPRKYN